MAAAVYDSEDSFRLAINSVACGVYMLDLEGLVTYVNPAAEKMFGWANADLLGKKMHDVTHYKYPDGISFPARNCLELQILEKDIAVHAHQDTFIRRDGSFFPVVLSASPLKRDGKAVGIVVAFSDESDRREAERVLREDHKRFLLLANTTPVMIWMSGIDKLCTYFNQRWLEFTGRPLEAELGNGWIGGVHEDDLNRVQDTYITAFDKRAPFKMEYRLRRYDGQYRWVLDSGVPMFDPNGSFTGYIGSATDVTEQNLAMEAISMVSRRLMQAQEEERTRIARELHDDIGQRLSLLALNLGRLTLHTSLGEVQEGIAKAIQDVSSLNNDMRVMAHRLHSSTLEHLGLASAASAHCSERSEQYKIEISFHSQGIPEDLSPEVSLCLFRVLQEALQNAIKYSDSQQIDVSITGGTSDIELVVEDFGVGFDPSAEAIKASGLGLTSMKERLKLVGGQLSIKSEPEGGTTIRATVPRVQRKHAP